MNNMSVQMMGSVRATLEPHVGSRDLLGNRAVKQQREQEIQMCRNKGIPATLLLGVWHCNAIIKGINAEPRGKK